MIIKGSDEYNALFRDANLLYRINEYDDVEIGNVCTHAKLITYYNLDDPNFSSDYNARKLIINGTEFFYRDAYHEQEDVYSFLLGFEFGSKTTVVLEKINECNEDYV